MEEFFNRVGADLLGRTTGPMTARLLIQPLTASILAIRAGLRDSREHRPPFFWAMAFVPEHRGTMLRQAWRDTCRVFFVGVVLDVVYQIIELRMFYPGEALVVAALLAIAPYVLVRAAVTRIAGWVK